MKKENNKRKKIMKAALELVAENGFHNSPTSQIAKNAGVGAGTIYRYFENKDILIREIHDEIRKEILEYIFKGDNPDLPVRDRFICFFSGLAGFLLDNHSKYKYIEQYYNSPYGIDEKRACKEDDPFEIFFNHAKQQHIMKDIDNEILFALAFGPISFLLKDHCSGFIELNDEIIQKVIRASWDALKL
ncbi:Transcriptional regulator, TetR-type [Desulfonema limicola]|uniref:Transcriptional regulator, TetR-type n=1 Tax=Desulfonema limicola TaxID=45656 RepID=A0A975B8Y2_9BACT|nr:TetR/AcrR family transcriptional regulator [Desulfonema limicola]QTA81063.1 Transcriptional regulator, TetR-type [Desulfonema limicola]